MEQEAQPSCCTRFKLSLGRLLYEFVGTFLFTMIFINMNQFVLAMGLWIVVIFCWKTSGAQLNPAITAAYVLRKDERPAYQMHMMLGLMYIGAQVAGAYVGATLMSFLNWDLVAIRPENDKWIFPAMMQETLGTFVLVFFYLMQSDSKQHFSKEPAINCFIISSSYVAARAIFDGGSFKITNYGACLNPAIAAGITIAAIVTEGAKSLTYCWIYPVMPFCGAFLAFLFYELVYKKTQKMLKHTREEHDEHEAEQEAEHEIDSAAELKPDDSETALPVSEAAIIE